MALENVQNVMAQSNAESVTGKALFILQGEHGSLRLVKIVAALEHAKSAIFLIESIVLGVARQALAMVSNRLGYKF